MASAETGGDAGNDVRSPLNPQWRQSGTDLRHLLGRITALTAPARLTVLLFYCPKRPQTALTAEGSARSGIDPLALGEALGPRLRSTGCASSIPLARLPKAPDFQSRYYVTHPSPADHVTLAAEIQHALLSDPAFARCTRLVSRP
jgi:hypothetical protein